MRLENCRVCGLEMEPDQRCEVCKNFVRLHCPKCGKTNDPQVHLHNLNYSD